MIKENVTLNEIKWIPLEDYWKNSSIDLVNVLLVYLDKQNKI